MEQLNNRNFYFWTPNLNSKNSSYLRENSRLELHVSEAPRLTIATSRRSDIKRNTWERSTLNQTLKVWRKRKWWTAEKGPGVIITQTLLFSILRNVWLTGWRRFMLIMVEVWRGCFTIVRFSFLRQGSGRTDLKRKKKVSQLGLYKASQI